MPGYDSFDYQDAWDFNFSVMNSSWALLSGADIAALSISSTAIRTDFTAKALEVAASTASLQAELDASQLDIITASTGSVATARVNLSTVTTALALYLPKAGGTLTGSVIGTHIQVSSMVATYTVSIGSTVPTQALVVIGSTTVTGESMTRGNTAWGRVTSAPSGALIGGIDMSWNGHSSAARDNAAQVGGSYRISDGAIHSWSTDVGNFLMRLSPGADDYGHMTIGYGGAGVYDSFSNDYSINAREGVLAGFNSSGNTKQTGNEAFAIEDSGNRSALLLGNAGARAWTLNSNSIGSLTISDSGQYGSSNGVGTVMTFSPTSINHSSATFGQGLTQSSFTYQGFFQPIAKTRAQIDLLIPAAGAASYIDCTDCTLPGLCRSTGTLAAQWRKVESATLGCGTNN